MLAVAGMVLGSLLVLGFYGYVFLRLYREHKRFRTIEKRLNDYFFAAGSSIELKAGRLKQAVAPKIPKRAPKETLIHVGVALGGLLGVFAEIGLLNWVVNSFH